MKTITILQLIFTGPDKKDAVVKFQPGFNVISGPSDTGKSLIYECLVYLLGGSDQPKHPPEAIGYTNLFLSIEIANELVTIERSVLSADVRIYQGKYSNISEESEYETLSTASRASKTLNNFLMCRIDIQGKRLKINESDETISLTFNVLRALNMVSDTAIIAKRSPIYNSYGGPSTSDKALFHFVLTGEEHSNIIPAQKPEIRKADANARIRILEALIKKRELNANKDISREELSEQLEKLDQEITQLGGQQSVSLDEIDSLQVERKSAWDLAAQSEFKIEQLKALLSRFELLTQQYKSDADRLDAIIETGDQLSQTEDAFCPVCGATEEHHRPECVLSDNQIDAVKQSCEAEKQKIKSLENDLSITIFQVKDDIAGYLEQKEESEKCFKRLDQKLADSLKPYVVNLSNQLRKAYENKRQVDMSLELMDQLNELSSLKKVAEHDFKKPPKRTKISVDVSAAEAAPLLKIIKKILQGWGYTGLQQVGFSEDNQDITLDDKNRREQGTGYRAITHAAFNVGLMEYCFSYNRPHPGFLVLDSPLVTFRKADSLAKGEEEVPNDMKLGFFIDLSGISLDKQIIVMGHETPPDDVLDKVNHVHFTKDSEFGRYGFLPLEQKDDG